MHALEGENIRISFYRHLLKVKTHFPTWFRLYGRLQVHYPFSFYIKFYPHLQIPFIKILEAGQVKQSLCCGPLHV